MSQHRIAAGLAVVLTGVLATPALATPPGRNGLIVWQRAAESTPLRLWVANADGSGARKVFAGTRRQSEFEGTFSPTDANTMFFSRGPEPFRPFTEDLFRGDLATGAVTRVRAANTADIAPTVSPDGTRLAFFAVTRGRLGEDAPPVPQRIHVSNLDGSGDRALTSARGQALDPDWSPDGTRLVFTEARFSREQVADRLVLMNADGTGRRPLTSYGRIDAINPKWTPDGQTIVFENIRHQGRRSRIMAMPAAGGPARVIYDSPGWDTNPIPSPDGTRILFTSDRHRPRRERINPSFELYTMAADGTNVARVTTNRSIDFFPDWQRLP